MKYDKLAGRILTLTTLINETQEQADKQTLIKIRTKLLQQLEQSTPNGKSSSST